nr:unnamed protein product [Digitaria exilis]
MAPAGSIGAGTEAAPAGSPMPGIGAAPAPAVSEVPATATGAASAAAQSLEERFSILLSIAEECVEEDEFAMLNKKMGGDLDAIRTVGSYMVEVWKALGVNMDSVEFLWSSEEISKRPNEYLSLVMDIAMTRRVLPGG